MTPKLKRSGDRFTLEVDGAVAGELLVTGRHVRTQALLIYMVDNGGGPFSLDQLSEALDDRAFREGSPVYREESNRRARDTIGRARELLRTEFGDSIDWLKATVQNRASSYALMGASG